MSAAALVGDLHRDVVAVTGSDAASFLQGQVSQDVEAMAEGQTKGTFVLQPQGKVDVWGRITRRGANDFVIDVDAGFGPALVDRLKRFKLRVDVDLELLPPVTVDTVDGTAHEGERIAAGVPRMGHEISASTIPAELGQWVIDESVSFTKGCFTGQELVARIDSRGGNVPRHLRVVEIDGDQPPTGAALVVEGKPVGDLTSVVASDRPGRSLALAFVPRAVEVPASAELSWDGGRATATIIG